MDMNNAFLSFYDIVARLRGPDGCPWDREQTPESLRSDLIEEIYECIEAIDEKDANHIKEELGDILLLVTMIAYMHEQKGIFSIYDVLTFVCEKLIRRHPHVFGNIKFNNSARCLSSAEVLDNWAKIKVEQEGRKPKDSILDGVGNSLPPMERSFKLQKKAAKTGFDWPDSTGVIAKIKEELAEVETVMANKQIDYALEEELGDLLFSAINLCRYLDIDPSVALQRTNIKFTKRFKHVEKCMKENNCQMNAENLAVMDQYWNEAKTSCY
jgi:tetrapyrrole methylase family protein/MazG family protein